MDVSVVNMNIGIFSRTIHCSVTKLGTRVVGGKVFLGIPFELTFLKDQDHSDGQGSRGTLT